MAAATPRTHYEVLGVSSRASAPQVRAAHRQLAQLLHPDRQAGASAAERALAERRMREVNAAWTVLSDPERRRRYDESLRAPTSGRSSGSSTSGSAGTGPPRSEPQFDDPDEYWAQRRAAEIDPDEPELHPVQFWLLRRGPIVAALIVAAILFVGTAVAGSGGGVDSAPPSTAVPIDANGGCVAILNNGQAYRVSCAGPNAGRIDRVVPLAQSCPEGTDRVAMSNEMACIDDAR